MLLHRVIFIVTTLTYVAANTVQHGVHFIDSQIFEQSHPLQVNEISNRDKRNAFDIPNFSEITVDTADKIRRNVFQNVISALPNKDIIKDLLPLPKTKRSFYDYDSSENQENIDPKRQLEQIASRNFSPDVRNEDQQIKEFFSRIFSMINSNKNCSNSEIYYNGRGHDNDLTNVPDATLVNKRYNSEDYLVDNDDQSSDFLQLNVKDLWSDRSETLDTGKFSNLKDFDLDKNTYVPIRKLKARRDIQDYSFPQNSMNFKTNSRPKRQLEELNYEDDNRKQFNTHSNLEGLVLEKNRYGLIKNLKKRQEAQDDSLPLNYKNAQDDSFSLNGVNVKVNPRPERQLSELINDDGNRKQFNKDSNSKDLLSEKSPNVPIRRLKKHQKVQDDSFPSNYKNSQDDSIPADGMNVKTNLRPERQLGELRNDDSTHKKFYVYSEVDSRAIDEYEDSEPPMEQQLPYGPTEDDMVQSSSADISLTTTELNIANHESNEEIDDNPTSVNLVSSTSTIISQSSKSYTTPTDIDETEENRMISSKHNMNSPKPSDFYQRTTNVLSFKMNKTDQTPTKSSRNTSSVQNNNNITNFDRRSKVIDKLKKTTTTYVPTVNAPDDNTAGHYQSPKHLHQDQNNLEKISSRRANIYSGKENVERKQTEVTSMIKKDGASLESDIKVAKVSEEADVTTNKNDILVNPLSARIKLDLFIHLQPSGNDEH